MFSPLRSLLLLVAFFAAAPAFAQQDEAPAPRSERESAEDRVREVERDGGRVLQAEPMQRGGREVYRLKVLTPEGRVRVLHNGNDGRREPRPARAERTERTDSARQSPMLRGRDSDSRRAAPPAEAADRPNPRHDQADRSGGRNDRD